MLRVLASVPLMITGLVPCVNHCVRVLFIPPRSFVLGFYPVFCIVFVWSSSRAVARRNLGTIKKKRLRIPASVFRIIHINVTHENIGRTLHVAAFIFLFSVVY